LWFVHVLTRDVKKTRRVLRTLSVVFFAAAIGMVVFRRAIIDALGPEIEDPRPGTKRADPVARSMYATDEEFERDYAPIWRARMGARKESPRPPVPEANPAPAPAPPRESLASILARRWTLVACAPHSDSARSAAIFHDRQTGKQVVAFVGAELEPGGARIESMTRTSVFVTQGIDRGELEIVARIPAGSSSLGRSEVVKIPQGGFRREEVAEYFRGRTWVEVQPFGLKLGERRQDEAPQDPPSLFGDWLRLSASTTLLFIDDAPIQSLGVVLSRLNCLAGPSCRLVVRDPEGKREITIGIREG
jgi:hypothetical protein